MRLLKLVSIFASTLPKALCRLERVRPCAAMSDSGSDPDLPLLTQCGLSYIEDERWEERSASEASIDMQQGDHAKVWRDDDSPVSSRDGDDESVRLQVDPDDEDLTNGLAPHGFALPGLAPDAGLDADDGEIEPTWQPGESSGPWFVAGRFIVESCQVLIANVFLNFKQLPSSILQSIVERLCPDFRVRGGRSWPAWATSAVTRLHPRRIERLMSSLSRNNWQPAAGQQQAEGEHMAQAKTFEDAEKQLLTLTRAALAVRAAHAPEREYVKYISRLAVEQVDVGHKLHTRHHFRDVMYLASKCLRCYDARELRQPLPGLGIRSDFALLVDGVPIGGVRVVGKHGTAVVCCLNSVCRSTGRLFAKFVAWCNHARGHKGEDVAEDIVAALGALPLGLTRRELRASLTVIGGDGAIVTGGPERSKPGTAAAELLWNKIHPTSLQGDDEVLADVALPPRRRLRQKVKDDKYLHHCTEWDKFHREDIALSRAIKKSPMAEEVYQVSAAINHMFHYGDGRLILESAGRAVGHHYRGSGMPGGTRKAVGLGGEPGHLLANYAAYAAGLHGRMEWKRLGHGKQYNARVLVDCGRRLTALDFLAFTTLFRDIFRYSIATWSETIQSSALEPWVLQAKRDRHERDLKETHECIEGMHKLLRVCVLLRQHATFEDVKQFIHAVFFASPAHMFAGCTSRAVWGRRIPTFVTALGNLLHGANPTFRRVSLLAPIPPQREKMVCLGPHCQCSFLASRRRRPERTTFKMGRTKVRGPSWVANSPKGGASLEFLRFHYRDPEAPNPLHVNMANRFRPRIRDVARGRVSRCVMPHGLPECFALIDKALHAAAQFVMLVRDEEAQMYGGEGQNAGMQRACRAMCKCFDWSRLCMAGPTPEDVREFGLLSTMLKPYLKYTDWPDFPEVPRAWPCEQVLQVQYVRLCRRVLDAPCHVKRDWWKMKGYDLEPVRSFPSILRFVRQLFPPAESAMWARVASVLSQLLGSGFLRDALVAQEDAVWAPIGGFFLSEKYIVRCGFPWKGRKRPCNIRRSIRSKWAYVPSPGGLATVVFPGDALGKLVYVRRKVLELDASAVSASMDMNPYFHRGIKQSPSPRNTSWHAVRVHHRCRTMGSAECCCERVGSLMQNAWFARRYRDFAYFMDGIFLDDAQVLCIGNRRDEMLAAEVTRLLMLANKNATLSARYKRQRSTRGIAVSSSVHNLREDTQAALLASGHDRIDSDDSDESVDLSTVAASSSSRFYSMDVDLRHRPRRAKRFLLEHERVQEVLDRVVSKQGSVAALPLFYEDPRTAKKSRAGSVIRDTVNRWLESEEGKSWMTTRDKALGAGLNDELSGSSDDE